MTAEKFWLGWLKATVIFNTGMGISMLFFSQSPLLCELEQFAQFTTTLAGGISCADIRPLAGWLVTGTGTIMINWGIFLIYLAWFRVPKGDIQAVNVMIISLLVWFLLDTGFAIYYQAQHIGIINVIVLFVWSAPLLSLNNIYRQRPKKVNYHTVTEEE